MQKLEIYLDQYENKELSDNIYKDYIKFGYKNEKIYRLDLDFLLTNVYNIKITKITRKRLNQTQFRKEILKKFNNTCIVSNETCLDELTAAHIIPVGDKENYDIDNGLLLMENLHKTFDNFKWSINPETLVIEINNNVNSGSIKKYDGKKLNIKTNDVFKANLQYHYDKFKNGIL